MPLTTQATRFKYIAAAIKRQLAAVLDLDESYIVLAANDDYELYPFDKVWVVIRYFGPTPFTDAGAGRRARPCSRLVRLYLYSRNSLDRVGDDSIALIDDGNHSDLEETVFDAMDEWFPLAADGGSVLTLEPLHPLDTASGPPVRKAEGEASVIRSHQDYAVSYLLPNSTPQPGLRP